MKFITILLAGLMLTGCSTAYDSIDSLHKTVDPRYKSYHQALDDIDILNTAYLNGEISDKEYNVNSIALRDKAYRLGKPY